MQPVPKPPDSGRADRAFARFCTAGDADALAQVFDATAPRLILVAMHLVRDVAAAEDLLQTAFVEAIQSAATFEVGRPVLPWLMTIMARRAANLRRDVSRRRVGSLESRELMDSQLGPAELLAQQDLIDSVAQAVGELASPYREVLVLRLVHSLAPLEIARALDRPPGTVHAQLHRGLQQLRRILPRGIAGSVALFAMSGRGLAGVRSEVVALGTGGGSAGVAFLLGGLMMKQMVSVAIAVAMLGVVGLWGFGGFEGLGESDRPPVRTEPLVVSQGAITEAMATDLRSGQPVDDATRAVHPPDHAEAMTQAQPVDSLASDFIRILGTCVGPRGLPVPDARVRVRTWLPGRSRSSAEISAGVRPSRAVDQSVEVRQDGSFELRVPRRSTQHRIEARCPSRVSWVWEAGYLDGVDSDGVLDLGRICLFPSVQLRARVLGTDGRPLQGVLIELRTDKPVLDNARAVGAQSVEGVRTGVDGGGIRPLALRRAVWRISLHGQGAMHWQPESVDLTVVGDHADLEIRAECSLPVTGTVVDETGAPIPHCNVNGRKSATDRGLGPFCATDDQGRFRLFPRSVGQRNPPPIDLRQAIVLVTSKKGFEHTASAPLPWGSEAIRLVVRREARLRLRVRSAAGPVIRYVVCLDPVGRGAHFDGLRVASDGCSEVRLPDRGRSLLWVVPEDLSLSPVGPIEVVVPLQRDTLEVVAPAARLLTVRVENGSGPIPGVSIELIEQRGAGPLPRYRFSVRRKTIFGGKRWPWLWQQAETDARGEARLCLPPTSTAVASRLWFCLKSPTGQTRVVRLDPAQQRQLVVLAD